MKISLDKAIELINDNIIMKEQETVFIGESLGRTLAENIYACVDNPPFNRSPYDGYALKAAETPGGFKVTGVNYAGKPSKFNITSGEAVRIMTGGAIPDGADCVVPQEAAHRGEEYVEINDKYSANDNFIRKGEDFLKGELLVKKNKKLCPADMALIAAGGIDRIKVYPRLSVSVISTGNEIVEAGKNIEFGQIYDTNLIYVASRLMELGCDVVHTDTVYDDMRHISEAVSKLALISDLIVTTGGVSVGEKDLVPEAVKSAGAEIVFHGIDIKPGMPTMLSVLDNKSAVLSLSGNPFAAAVGLEVIGRHIISAASGNPSVLPVRFNSVLANGFEKRSKSRRFIKAVEKNGIVTIPVSQGNSSLKSTAECNCFIDVPAGTEKLNAGDRVVIFFA